MKKYHAEEELVEVDDGWSGSDMDVYLATDVHAHVANIIATDSLKITQLEYRIAELERAYEANALASGEVIEDRNKRIAELEKALREYDDLYARVWDRVDGALVLMPDSIPRFESAHEQAQRLLMVG